MGLALLLAQFDQSFHSTDELRDLGFPVVGGVSFMGAGVPFFRRALSAAVFALDQGTKAAYGAVAKPVEGTVRVGIGGVEKFENIDFTCDHATGVIRLTDAPMMDAPVTAGFEFDVPVRFDADALDVTLDLERLGSITSIPLLELRR